MTSSKIPREIQATIEEKAGQKLVWVKRRLVEICLEIEGVSRWDNLQEEFKEKVAEVQRKFPKATLAALTSFMAQTYEPAPRPKKDSFSLDYEVFQGGYVLAQTAESRSPQNLFASTPSKEAAQSRVSLNRNRTINLSHHQYARPSTAATVMENAAELQNKSYFGGFFSTQANFTKQIEDQLIAQVTSPIVDKRRKTIKEVTKGQPPLSPQPQLMKSGRPFTQQTMNFAPDLSNSQLFRPQTAGLNFATLQQLSASRQSSRYDIPSQSGHSFKGVQRRSLEQKSPGKAALESASTFVCSVNRKFTVPTYSKLQLAKKLNYVDIINNRRTGKYYQLGKDGMQKAGLEEEVRGLRCSFSVPGRKVTLKDQVKRRNTPNFVDLWAKANQIDLKTPKLSDADRKRQMAKMRKSLAVSRNQEAQEAKIALDKKRRFTTIMKRMSTVSMGQLVPRFSPAKRNSKVD